VDRRIHGSDEEGPNWASWLKPLKDESTSYASIGEETIPPEYSLDVYEVFTVERARERWTDSYEVVERHRVWETWFVQRRDLYYHGGGGGGTD
jgi:hypothetical protein